MNFLMLIGFGNKKWNAKIRETRFPTPIFMQIFLLHNKISIILWYEFNDKLYQFVMQSIWRKKNYETKQKNYYQSTETFLFWIWMCWLFFIIFTFNFDRFINDMCTLFIFGLHSWYFELYHVVYMTLKLIAEEYVFWSMYNDGFR